MIISADILNKLKTTFSQDFEKGKSLAASQYKQIATIVPSSSKSNTYGWLGQWPTFREWIGERVIQNLKAYGYSITNKPFESTIAVSRDDIEDDDTGIYSPLFEEMGRSSEVFPDELLLPLLDSGTSNLCYDGKPFFATDHPAYPNTDGTGAAVAVSNYNDGGASAGPAWYLLDTSRALKPFIYQSRREMQFTAMTKPDDEYVFRSNEFRFGVDCRANAGYGFWQMAYCSKAELTAANVWAGIEVMKAFKADGGRPLAIKPMLLVVRSSQERAGLEALKATFNGGDSNTLHGQLTLLVANYL